MKRLIIGIIGLLLLSGCSAGSVTQKGAAGKVLGVRAPTSVATPVNVDSSCADKFVHEFATGKGNGGWNCLSTDFQFQLTAQFGVVDDSSLMMWLSGNDPSGATFDVLSPTPPPDMSGQFPAGTLFYHFSPSSEKGTPGYYTDGFMWQVTVDVNGKITNIQRQ